MLIYIITFFFFFHLAKFCFLDKQPSYEPADMTFLFDYSVSVGKKMVVFTDYIFKWAHGDPPTLPSYFVISNMFVTTFPKLPYKA